VGIQIETLENGIKQIILTGRLDIKGTGEIETRFVNNTVTKKAPILVDLSGVDFIASYGMRMLLGSAKALEKRGGKMILFQPTALVQEALQMAGIDQLIPIYDDFEAANADLLAAVPQ
jgi:anti-anti-sigma factor